MLIVTGQISPSDLALDDSKLYFTDSDAGTIMAAPKQGGAAVALASDQARPWRIALDTDHVYWTNRTGGSVARVAKTGGVVEYLAPATNPWGLVVAGDYLYWTNAQATGSVQRVLKTGGVAQSLTASAVPTEMSADSDFVYYFEDTGTAIRSTYIRKLEKSSGRVTLLHEEKHARNAFFNITSDCGFLYLFAYTLETSLIPTIVRVDKSTGQLTPLLRRDEGVGALLVDNGTMYFNALSGIARATTVDGHPTMVAPISGGSLRADTAYLYWTQPRGIGRAPRR